LTPDSHLAPRTSHPAPRTPHPAPRTSLLHDRTGARGGGSAADWCPRGDVVGSLARVRRAAGDRVDGRKPCAVAGLRAHGGRRAGDRVCRGRGGAWRAGGARGGATGVARVETPVATRRTGADFRGDPRGRRQ